MTAQANPLRSLRWIAAFGAAVFSLSAASVWANENPDLPSKLEALRLPPYCHKQFGIPSNAPATWEICGHLMNHFCPALVFIGRASKPTATKFEKRANAGRARTDLEYTKKGMPARCSLAADVNEADARLRVIELFAK